MKKILYIIIIVLSALNISGQSNYGSDVLDTTINPMKGIYNFTPTGNNKIIRLIFHFMLKDDGTGNFNEINDGLTPANNLNGYDYAEYIVELLNNHMSNPCEMSIHPFGSIPVYDAEYRFELVGTFFWRSTANYTSGLSTLYNAYAKNTNDCINIFFVHDENSNGGYVRYLGDNAVWSGTHYQNYKTAIQNNNMWYNDFTQKLLNHELGHCFNLHHTLMTGGGICVNNYNDYCDDTPTIQDMLDIGEPNPCCWNDTYCSNNLMDYNASKCALTPDQLGRVHNELDNDKYNSWLTHFNIPLLNICNISLSDSYIGEIVKFAETCPAIIENGKVIFVNASEVVFHPGFEVKTGGMLFVKTNDSE